MAIIHEMQKSTERFKERISELQALLKRNQIDGIKKLVYSLSN